MKETTKKTIKEFLEGTPQWVKTMKDYDTKMCPICGMNVKNIERLYEALKDVLKD